jgi:hypothetical protein
MVDDVTASLPAAAACAGPQLTGPTTATARTAKMWTRDGRGVDVAFIRSSLLRLTSNEVRGFADQNRYDIGAFAPPQ